MTGASRRTRRLLFSALVTALGVALLGLGASPAQATDNSPCFVKGKRAFTHAGATWNETLRTCPLWRGKVPVHFTTDPASPIVGYLDYGGNANWFLYERQGKRASLGGATNVWWASTLADNGKWGWVNEIYFRGGANDEDDAGLLRPGTYTCANVCPPLPPWVLPRKWRQRYE